MPGYQFQPVKAAILLSDTPAGYAPPRGPRVSFTLRYDHRDQRQPQLFNYGNVGPRWTFDWLSYVSDNYTSAYAPYTWTRVYLQGQSEEWYGGQDSSPYHWRSRAQLVKVSNDPVRYERRLPDGTVQVFDVPDRGPNEYGRRVFLTQIIDPQGQTLTFTYDGQLRMIAATDAVGQVTTLSYADPSDPLRLTSVVDPFGRTATLTYNANGQLASITDVIGMTSSFAYDTEDFIGALRTPYGTTSFRRGESVQAHGIRWVEATDPIGGTERLEFRYQTADLPVTVPASEVPAGFEGQNVSMDSYNTLYWNQRAMSVAPGQASSAVITSWLMSSNMAYSFIFSRNIPHSIKKPLENRVWYRYPNQSSPRIVGQGTSATEEARVLPDGSTQVWRKTYNSTGRLASRSDPLGRETSYTYAANGIDLLEIRQKSSPVNHVIASLGNYTAGHLPGTIVDAAGGTTTLTYTAAGNIASVTNVKNEVTTYGFDANGNLQSVINPFAGAVSHYTYDSYGRVRTTADSTGFTLTFAYDLLDRQTRTTYPDGTYDEDVYDKLDLVRHRDRLGRLTYFTYDANRRLVATRDPAGHLVRREWCGCGSLDAFIDGNGHKTTWQRDLQGRVVAEVRADTTTATSYTFDSSGRLKTVTDPQQQVTTHTYGSDDTLESVVFSSAIVPTAGVSYSYDSVYGRVTTMTDGSGTTHYGYQPVGTPGALKLATIDGPLPNDTIAYAYDELRRVVGRTINGSANSLVVTYDSLGRVTAETNPLGTFGYSYEGATDRLVSIIYPNGQTAAYTYSPAPEDPRLRSINHKDPAGQTIAAFHYVYDAAGNIVERSERAGAEPAVITEYRYDDANQLLRAVLRTSDPAPQVLKRYAYRYDNAGNRLAEQIDDAVTGLAYDSLNRVTTAFGGGPMLFSGLVNEPASIKVGGQPADVAPSGQFETSVSVPAGTSTVSITATDANGNVSAASYGLSVPVVSRTFGVSATGNLISDGARTFSWDARGQLAEVATGTQSVQFGYDGQRRRVKAVTKNGLVVEAESRDVWCETTLCESRRGDGATVARRVFALGEQVDGTSYYFALDHLGSVSVVTDSANVVRARYGYDPWGRRTLREGADVTDAGFTVHKWDRVSGLTMALYRAYDADIGRWISEDIVGIDAEANNLFEYANNSPINALDLLGDQVRAPMPMPRPQGGPIGGWSALFEEPEDMILPDRWPVKDSPYPKDKPKECKDWSRKQRYGCLASGDLTPMGENPHKTQNQLSVFALGYGPDQRTAAQSALDNCSSAVPSYFHRGWWYVRHCKIKKCWQQ